MKNTSKKAKRVLAMFLAMMMCLSMLNLTAFAEESAASEPAQAPTDGAPSTAVTDTPVTNETPATQPTEAPKPAETAAPTAAPTAEGTAAPAPSASAAPSAAATETPAGEPTLAPSAQPTQQPADEGSDDAPDGAAPDAGTPGADEEKPAEHEHTWENGKCTIDGCEAVCEHKEHTPEGKCTECGFECDHKVNGQYSFDAHTECTVCGKACEHPSRKDAYPYACNACGMCKSHRTTSFKNGVCETCGYTCKEHSFSTKGVCTVCFLKCPHEDADQNGFCDNCGAVNPINGTVIVSTQDEFNLAFNNAQTVNVIEVHADVELPKTYGKYSFTIRGDGHHKLTAPNGKMSFDKKDSALTLENIRLEAEVSIGNQGNIKLTLNSGASVKKVTTSAKSTIFTINAGSSVDAVSGCAQTTIAGTVGTLKITKGGIATMFDGASAQHVDVSSGATFTMNGGTISGGSAPNGGGVYVEGTFNMNGGTITKNTAKYGGGVYATGSSAIFTMTGGTITGNTATVGGGVYDSCSFNVSGTPVVSGNTPDNVYVKGNPDVNKYNKPIFVKGPLDDGAQLGVSAEGLKDGRLIAQGSNYTVTDEDVVKFASDVSPYVVAKDEKGENRIILAIPEGDPVASYVDANGQTVQTSLQKALNEVPEGRTVTLLEDVTAAAIVNIAHNATLDLAGHTLNLSGHHIIVPSGANFTLGPNGGVITGGGNANTCGGAVEVQGGTFTMYGGTLQGNTGKYGGAVYVAEHGKFIMYGGAIDNNTASNGGGIFVQVTAKAEIFAGQITNNKATCTTTDDVSVYPYGGGGIYVNGGKNGKANGELKLHKVAVTENSSDVDGAHNKWNIGAGISACPTSNIKVFITSGGIIAGNSTPTVSQVYVGGNKDDNVKHQLFLSKYALGGAVYNWTDAKGKPLGQAGEYQDTIKGGVYGFTDLSADEAKKVINIGLAKVVISGNTSAWSGGGIGSNGDVIIGTDKAVLPIRKVVDGEGTPAQNEFKFDVTLTWKNGTPYDASVMLNGAEMNGAGTGKFTLTLKAGETKVLTNMEVDVAYTITEQPSGASSVTVNNENGNTISGTTQLESTGVAEIVFTNTYDASTPTPPPTNPPVVVIPTPTPTPTVTPTPTPEPTEEPTPTPEPDEEIPDEDVPLGTPKPEPTPEPDEEIPDEDVPLGTPKPEPTPEPDEEIPDPDVPLGPSEPEPTPEPEEEIPDEDVPLANTPKTGDNADIWFLLSVISAAGLVFLGAAEWKKRKEDHKA